MSFRLLINNTTDGEASTRFDDFSLSIPVQNILQKGKRSTASISTIQLLRSTSRLRTICKRIPSLFFSPFPRTASVVVDGFPRKQQHARPIVTVADPCWGGGGHMCQDAHSGGVVWTWLSSTSLGRRPHDMCPSTQLKSRARQFTLTHPQKRPPSVPGRGRNHPCPHPYDPSDPWTHHDHHHGRFHVHLSRSRLHLLQQASGSGSGSGCDYGDPSSVICVRKQPKDK